MMSINEQNKTLENPKGFIWGFSKAKIIGPMINRTMRETLCHGFNREDSFRVLRTSNFYKDTRVAVDLNGKEFWFQVVSLELVED